MPCQIARGAVMNRAKVEMACPVARAARLRRVDFMPDASFGLQDLVHGQGRLGTTGLADDARRNPGNG